jgi:hypothetical protein
MELTSFAELKVTQEKLQMLEAFYAEQEKTPADNAFVKKQSQLSVKQMIDQLRGEITRFEARVCLPEQSDPSKIAEHSVHSSNEG